MARPPPNTMPHEAKLSAAYAIGTLSRHAATRADFDDAAVAGLGGSTYETSGPTSSSSKVIAS